MRVLLWVALLSAPVLAGCTGTTGKSPSAAGLPHTGAAAAPTTPKAKSQGLIVTPEKGLAGKVALVNATARYVVLTFPLGTMAARDQHLSLYRRGLKVGEVKVTGPQREDSIVADLVAGEAEVGDEARSQ
jgi:hypothetical protein